MKYWKYYFGITASIYLFVYLFYTFVEWRFDNPLEWLIQMPSYDTNKRGLILTGWIMYKIFFVITYLGITERNEESLSGDLDP